MTFKSDLLIATTFLVASPLGCGGTTTRVGPESIPLPHGAVARIGIGYWDGPTLELMGVSREAVLSHVTHEGMVSSIVFSPDGKALASASFDGTVRLWEVATGNELLRLKGHEGPVESVAFSPDGKVLASAGRDKTMRLWDAVTGEQLHALASRSFGYSVAFSPDRKHVATCGFRSIRLWHTLSGQELYAITGLGNVTLSIAFAPDGKALASGSHDNVHGVEHHSVALWDAATGRMLRKLGEHRSAVTSVAFSPNGRMLASGGNDKAISLWDVGTGRLLRSLESDELVYCLVFSPDGRILVSGGGDGTKVGGGITAWDPATGRRFGRLPGEGWFIHSLAFSSDGRRLASCGYDRTITIWDATLLLEAPRDSKSVAGM